jgi:amino acid adenylation domain-containing protein
VLDEIFRQVAKRQPGKVAVRGWDDQFTYRELDHRADRLAERLCEAGAQTGSVVAVQMDRSAAMIVAILAVIRAGAGYLALDQRQPAHRRGLIIQDAGARIALVAADAVHGLPEGCSPVFPDDFGGTSIPAAAPPSAGPEHLAYVAYTSGSTGAPKGVCVPHRAVARLVLDNGFLPIQPDDVFVHYAPLAFDASTLEIWGPLLTGACLVIPPPGVPTPSELCAFVREAGVTVLWLTAGLFHQVVEAGLDDLSGLRHLLAGGDVLSVPHVNRALAALPDCVLINGYGPTENTTFTCCHRLTSAVHGPTVPIGRPVRGSTVHVLDDKLRAAGPGVAGELYAGGLGVAHGYLGDPVLTAQRFVPNPFAAEPGSRMYRSGDMVQWRGDSLEFLGRRDRQYKVRGFRVELSEVESAIAMLPGVAEVAVVMQPTRSGQRRIAAFVSGTASTLEIRRRLSKVLPDYAIPGLITRVEELPLKPAGKVDRGELEHRQAAGRPELSAAYRPPATGLEQALTQLWTDMFELNGLGADDDFFEVGGHSLLGVRVLTEVQREYGVEVSPVAFYMDPTPAGLARTIESARQCAESA